MHTLYWIISVLSFLWLLIWIDAKRAKVHMHEEGWIRLGRGMIKRFPKKPPTIERHEEAAYFHELMDDQSN
jgi:hypothetical protein